MRKYGWKPDLPDFRDLKFKAAKPIKEADLPPFVDLRHTMPEAWNQGDIGSCTAHALGAALWSIKVKEGEKPFMPSRLFIYYNEREAEGTVNEDAGAFIRTGIKTMNKIGVCEEKHWPYHEHKFTKKPTKKAYKAALGSKVVSYMRIDNTKILQVRKCLADGYPIVFGFSVFDSFESDELASTGIMKLPNKDEKSLGGHAVTAVGYNESKKHIIVRNSWGPEWGDKGYFYMPYEYVTTRGLSEDYWTIRAEDKGAL